MTEPLVSIVIPTCDRPLMLAEAVESLKLQTYKNIETIIVDDSRAKAGPGLARQQGIHLSHGDYIAFLDDDDRWDDCTYLSRAMDVLKSQWADMVHCDARISDSAQWPFNRKTFNAQQAQLHKQTLKSGGRALRNAFLCPTLGMGVVVRRSLFDKVPYPSSRLLEDYEFQLAVAASRHGIYYFHEPIGLYRIHAGNSSKSGIVAAAMMVDLLERYCGTFRADDEEINQRMAQAYMDLCAAYARARHYGQAFKYFHIALSTHPRYTRKRATDKALDWMTS